MTDTERTRTVRVLVWFRLIVVTIYAASTGYSAYFDGVVSDVVTLPLIGGYVSLALLLVLLWDLVPFARPWLNLGVGLIDIPMMCLAAAVAVPTMTGNEDPKLVLSTILPYSMGAITLSALSLDYVVIAVTTVASAIAGAWLTLLVGAPTIYVTDPLVGSVGTGILAAFLVSRLRSLVEESRRKDFAGKYILGDRIGSGGMAEVFLATYSPGGGFERRVAVKRVLPAYAKDQQFVAMFRREAELGSQLAHPNLVQVLDFGQHLDSWFIAMEYVEGVSASDLISDALPIEAALYVIAEVAEGLTYLHERRSANGAIGLVHRDLNPPNILVSFAGEVKVSDFGVARWTSHGERLTQTGTVRGKLTYMAPEYLAGAEPSPLGDLYALGVMAYELVTHRRLYAGKSDAEIANLIINRDIEPPSVARPEVPPEVDALVAELVARDPAKRPASARQVASTLRAMSGSFAPYRGGRAALLFALGQLSSKPAVEQQNTRTLALPPTNPEAPPLA